MRPAGEVRQALLDAAQALATPDRGATLTELAAHAGVGLDAATWTVKNMVRAKVLRTPRRRPVAYRNKPVAEYEPVASAAAGIATPLSASPTAQAAAALAAAWTVQAA